MKSWIPLLMAAAGLALPGCFVGVDHGHGHGGDGVFTVEWSIDGDTRGSDCDYYGATDVDITILTPRGDEYDYATVPCDRFGYDFDVEPGDYSVEVVMLDRGRTVSTTISTDIYPVRSGGGNYVSADFPPDSFR